MSYLVVFSDWLRPCLALIGWLEISLCSDWLEPLHWSEILTPSSTLLWLAGSSLYFARIGWLIAPTLFDWLTPCLYIALVGWLLACTLHWLADSKLACCPDWLNQAFYWSGLLAYNQYFSLTVWLLPSCLFWLADSRSVLCSGWLTPGLYFCPDWLILALRFSDWLISSMYFALIG